MTTRTGSGALSGLAALAYFDLLNNGEVNEQGGRATHDLWRRMGGSGAEVPPNLTRAMKELADSNLIVRDIEPGSSVCRLIRVNPRVSVSDDDVRGMHSRAVAASGRLELRPPGMPNCLRESAGVANPARVTDSAATPTPRPVIAKPPSERLTILAAELADVERQEAELFAKKARIRAAMAALLAEM